jgi:hypothetical protein
LVLQPVDIVDKNLRDSIIEHPKLNEGRLRFGVTKRGPLLPAWGSRERERWLRDYWRHDYNTLFRGAVTALVKRVQSTPYVVKAPAQDGNRWQEILMSADFGDWDRFLSKLIVDYSRQDQGAFLELIAPGDPRKAPTGAVTGLAVLDSLRCYPTGDPEYPVIYYDLKGAMHILHRGRVVQFVDSPDSDENTPGYGDCALSRSIAPVKRQILMGRYVEQALDDEPPPGVVTFGNIAEEEVNVAIERMQQNRSTDTPGEWGRVIRLYGLHKETKPTVETTSFTKPPENFDFDKFTNLDAREIALELGIDVQDIWGELSGGGLGRGQESEILAQKSRGKGFGRILKSLERVINRVFPVDVEFSFTYKDPQEDMEQAQILQLTAGAIQIVGGVLTPDEQRTLLANTIPAIHDVLVDETGNVRRLSDADPEGKPEEIKTDIEAETPEATASMSSIVPALQKATKDFSDTAFTFAVDFTNLVSGAGSANPAVVRSLLRDSLWNSGMLAYEDGLRDGGADPGNADAEELARRRRVVAEWNASQTGYIESFVDEVMGAGLTADQIRQRADLWVSKSLRAIYYAGMQDADEQQVYEWQLGSTKEHCRTCLSLNGQVHKMREYVKAGLLPGSSSLECKGYHCGCRLVKSTGSTRGTLPGGGRPSLADRLTGWLRGLLGR